MSLTTNLLDKIGGGVKSLVLIFFGSAKSAIFNVIVGFFEPGFGYLEINKNLYVKEFFPSKHIWLQGWLNIRSDYVTQAKHDIINNKKIF